MRRCVFFNGHKYYVLTILDPHAHYVRIAYIGGIRMKYTMLGLLMIILFSTQVHAGGSYSTPYVVDEPGFEVVRAAMKDNTEQVRRLIAADVDGLYAHHRDRALLEASARGHHATVKVLIEANANVNYREGDGNTPLMSAAQNGHIEVIEELLQAPNIDVDANRQGNTALSLAWGFQRDKKPQALKLLREFKDQRTRGSHTKSARNVVPTTEAS